MEYSDKLLEHFYAPRNVGFLPDASGIGEEGDPKCGDVLKMYIKVENNIIKEVRFKAFGCGSAIASASIATELIKNKSLEDAWEITNKSVIEALDGMPSSKIHCSVLAEQTIHKAINDYRTRNGLNPWEDKLNSHD